MIEELAEKLLNAKDSGQRLGILTEIGNEINNGLKIDNTVIVGHILLLFNDDNDFVRIKLTELAEHTTDEKIVDVLIDKLLNDSNYFVRGFAAKALGSIGNIKSKEALEKASFDKEGFVVSFATQALKTINMKVSFSSKLNMLKNQMKAGIGK